ncbi:MAG TPA: peptidoglycan recognition family protein [Jiangellaceae bacterium]
MRLKSRIRYGAALVGAVAVVPLAAAQGVSATEAETRQEVYEAAAEEFGVPVPILLGVSYLEARWDANAGEPSTVAGYGPMHLTDAEYVLGLPGFDHHHSADEDPRGDDSRDFLDVGQPDVEAPNEPGLQTLEAAAALTGVSEEQLRTDAAANIRGGAALLASYQAKLGAPTGVDSDPADWFGAVARYSGSDTEDAARVFANEVYSVINEGASRTTDDGSTVTLAAQPHLQPEQSWLSGLGLRKLERPDGLECPVDISCEWLPAPYELRGDGTNVGSYGNHDKGNRPKQQKIEYILIHDAEGYFDGTTRLAQDKNWVSWHYTLRSSDGHIAQHLKAKDVGWHAGNWFVNAKSIGLEHEGFAAAQGTWYTEAMYRTSAKLVRYLALRLDIPIDRHHIIGHDNVQGITPAYVRGMHWDPGPYWDWAHYFELLKAPFKSTGTPTSGLVTINPDFDSNQPEFTGCQTAGVPCPPAGSSSVILHSAPSFDAPLVNDVGRCPNGPGTMYISDHCARASAGQEFAIADFDGDWTAIWYLGQKAWFYNPAGAPVAEWSRGFVVTPKAGRDTIPVYGRAYPEPEAFPEGVPVQPIVPLQYTLSAGERYAAGPTLQGEYYRATTWDWSRTGDGTVIRGDKTYVQINFGHRIGYVDTEDVDIMPANIGAPRP